MKIAKVVLPLIGFLILVNAGFVGCSSACKRDKVAVPKNFITRNGSVLMDGDKEFRFFRWPHPTFIKMKSRYCLIIPTGSPMSSNP